ncbi:hypothetical protein ACFO3D_09465 [Virgibacillus kekensis]|uniref:HEAT repeat domain-containing protein n=1 Tax=Virgibacillus kekensis TaxID=202261 RepID=A0ABV9DJ78_9BACI
MDEAIRETFNKLENGDKTEQYRAFQEIMAAMEKEVDWPYEIWDELKGKLTDADPHERSRAAQFLSGLAKSDPKNRMLHDFPAVWKVTKDEKFVTARHALQSIWKVGLGGEEQKNLVVKTLADRFKNCKDEKNYTLIRADIQEGLRKLYDATDDGEIRELALGLIDIEDDQKYRKKYQKVWKNT